jgi:hypothetical protein
MFLLIMSHPWKIAFALCIPKRVRPQADQHKEEGAQEVFYFVGCFSTGHYREDAGLLACTISTGALHYLS